MSAASRPACEVVERYVTPRAARNKNLQWRLIVNQDTSGNTSRDTSGNTSSREGAEYLRGVQVVRVGQCVRPGRRCAGAAQGPRYGQESECRQLYLDTRLVARSPDTGALTTDTFSFPSCCACHLRNTRGAGRGTLRWTGFR